MRASITFILCLAFFGALSACRAQDDQVVLRLAHSLDTGHPVHKAMLVMDEALQRLSGNSMRVAIYPAGQLGNERELIELLQIGSLAMTKVSASPLEGFVPVMKIFNLPYVFRSRAHYHAVLDSAVGQALLDAPQTVRLKGLGYYDAGARSFYSVTRPIRSPDDLTGMKIRVQESATAIAMVTALGGSPTPIAWGELYTALQQGVVDGAENNPPSFYLSGHYEICKFLTLDEHTAVPDILLMSTAVWDSLSDQQRIWLQQAVDESVSYQRAAWEEETQRSLAAVAAAGVEVIYPDKTAFQLKVSDVQQQYMGTEVGDLLQQISEVPDAPLPR